MRETDLQIPCDGCGEEFNPRLSNKKGWTCPNCKTRQPDMAFHYRVVAYLCIGGLLWTVYLMVATGVRHGGLLWQHLLPGLQTVFLLLAMTMALRHDRPWKSNALTAVIWLVFASFVFFYLFQPLLSVALLGIPMSRQLMMFLVPFGILMLLAGIYLFWLHLAARRLR